MTYPTFMSEHKGHREISIALCLCGDVSLSHHHQLLSNTHILIVYEVLHTVGAQSFILCIMRHNGKFQLLAEYLLMFSLAGFSNRFRMNS